MKENVSGCFFLNTVYNKKMNTSNLPTNETYSKPVNTILATYWSLSNDTNYKAMFTQVTLKNHINIRAIIHTKLKHLTPNVQM